MSTGDFIMPFGKYQGKLLSDIPTKYLDYMLGLNNLWPGTRAAILAHLRTRGNWQRMEEAGDV
ncbi:MAG TPA: DUF3820 family protein [Phycisphaerae bacterium]|nr:DUF3820 family protein [Phycisphaerae bacterium]HUX03008.1 DUF3820 family protein [Phycisphaerae bacterium]